MKGGGGGGEEQNTHLLAMYQNIPSSLERLINVIAGCFQMRAQVGRTRVQNVDAIVVVPVLAIWQPGNLVNLYEMGDGLLFEQILVVNGSH